MQSYVLLDVCFNSVPFEFIKPTTSLSIIDSLNTHVMYTVVMLLPSLDGCTDARLCYGRVGDESPPPSLGGAKGSSGARQREDTSWARMVDDDAPLARSLVLVRLTRLFVTWIRVTPPPLFRLFVETRSFPNKRVTRNSSSITHIGHGHIPSCSRSLFSL